jgi:hypothetical protein
MVVGSAIIESNPAHSGWGFEQSKVVEMVHCKASDELMLIIIIDRVLIASFAIISQSIIGESLRTSMEWILITILLWPPAFTLIESTH